MCNKYFRTSGASTKYFFGLSETFEKHGHQVIHFSMQDERNVPSAYADYFVSQVDFNRRVSPWRYLREFSRSIYSLEARRQVERLVKDTRPDIAMLFNIYHHLSPSILQVFRKYDLPIVLLVEDYFLICPSYRLYAGGEVCQRCQGGRFYQALWQRCFRDSLFRSFAAAAVSYVHKWLDIYDSNIHAYIAPSVFVRDRLVENGFDPDKITVIPHALPLTDIEPHYGGDDYIVYIGILEPWKGLSTLIRAMQALPHIRLVILGDGNQRGELEQQVRQLGLKNVEFAGYVIKQEFKNLVENCRLVVVPSEWYEVFGTVTWEAFAYGKPVVGSRIGATPELVKDGETGVLFDPGSCAKLAKKIEIIFRDAKYCRRLGQNARRMVDDSLNMEINYNSTFKVFEHLLSEKPVDNREKYISESTIIIR